MTNHTLDWLLWHFSWLLTVMKQGAVDGEVQVISRSNPQLPGGRQAQQAIRRLGAKVITGIILQN
jgi:hypothetical protein